MEWSGPIPTQPHPIRLRRLGRQPRTAPDRTRPHRPWGPHRTRRLHPKPAPAGQPSPHRIPPGHPRCSSCSVPARAATTYCGCFRPLIPPNMLKTTTLPWHTASPLCLTPDRSPQRLLPLHTSHWAWGALASPQPRFKHKPPIKHLGQMPSPSSSNTSAHHRGDPPPTTSEPNRTSPPSRHRISKFIDNTWMGTTWMGSLRGTQTTSTTATHPRRTQHRARMATPSGHRHPHQLPSRTPRKPRSTQPCTAQIPIRPARQQSVHNHPQQPRDNLPFPPLQTAAPSTSSTPTSPDQPFLPVPSRSWPLWRPPCSLCPSRDLTQPRRPPRASSSQNLQWSRSPGDHQHQNHWPQHWPRWHPRWQENWGHRQRPPLVGRSATSGWHNLGFPPLTSRATTNAGRAIQRHSSKGREEEQRTHLPWTPPGSAMSPCCLWDWSWRTLEWWSRNFPEVARPHQSPPSPSPPAPLPHQRPDPPLERHAHACGHACLCSIPPWPRPIWLPQPRRQHPFHQWDLRWGHQPPPLHQTSSPLLKRPAWTWPSPAHPGAAGI